MDKKRTQYRTIKLPKDFVENFIDPLVGKFGYSSRTEVCKDGVRMVLRQHLKENPEKEVG